MSFPTVLDKKHSTLFTAWLLGHTEDWSRIIISVLQSALTLHQRCG